MGARGAGDAGCAAGAAAAPVPAAGAAAGAGASRAEITYATTTATITSGMTASPSEKRSSVASRTDVRGSESMTTVIAPSTRSAP